MFQASSVSRRITMLCIAFSLLSGCGTLPPQKPAQTVAALSRQIDQYIAQPRFAAARWGVKIISLDSGKTLFAHDANKLFIPASNAKLYTSALALATFPADYRIPTAIYTTAPIDSQGVVQGDLMVYAQGDPTLGADAGTGAQSQPVKHLAAQLAQTGLKRVQGQLIIDTRYFSMPPVSAGWEVGDLQWGYGAAVSALNWRENAFTLTVKPALVAGQPCELALDTDTLADTAIAPMKIINRTMTSQLPTATGIVAYRKPGDNTLYVSGSLAMGSPSEGLLLSLNTPAQTMARTLLDALEKQGMTITGGFKVIDGLTSQMQTGERWQSHRAHFSAGLPQAQARRQYEQYGKREATPGNPLKNARAALVSPPISQIVQQALKRSQNLYAQSLLLQVGRHTAEKTAAQDCAQSGPACSTEQWGLFALDHFLKQAGVPVQDVLLQDGNGLARADLVTPAATVALLQVMRRRPGAAFFFNALPIAGVDGTLKNRMKGTAAENNVHAKTGTLTGVYTLSGYVTTAAKEHLAFSIMLNHYRPPKENSDDKATPVPSPSEGLDAIAVMLAQFTGISK
jgi:serine-type D-Ala-D-Ala carboxypeptidase/endopeptidase (penicillin-binding protein 4)